MQEVDSQVLQDVTSTLQLSTRGAQITEFDDAVLQQVLDVMPIVRRGGTRVGTDGVYGLTVTQAHAGAGSLTTDIDPYALTPGTNVVGTWPSAAEIDNYDIWLLGPLSVAFSVVANFAFGGVFLRFPAARMSGIDTAAANTNLILGAFDTANATLFVGEEIGTGKIALSVAQRVPRGTLLRFISAAQVGAVDINFNAMLGVFPKGLGQDAVGAG